MSVPDVKKNERIQFQAGGAPVPLSKITVPLSIICTFEMECSHTRQEESVMRRTETIGPDHSNRKPNHIEQEVDSHDKQSEPENIGIPSSFREVYGWLYAVTGRKKNETYVEGSLWRLRARGTPRIQPKLQPATLRYCYLSRRGN